MMMSRAYLSCCLALALASLTGACGEDLTRETGLVLEITTDLPMPHVADTLSIEIVAADRLIRRQSSLPDPMGMPIRRALTPGRDPSVAFEVRVSALLGAGVVVTRELQLRFAPGTVRVVPVELFTGCRSVMCSAGSTCTSAGVCGSSNVDVAKLTRWRGPLPDVKIAVDAPGDSVEPSPDAGMDVDVAPMIDAHMAPMIDARSMEVDASPPPPQGCDAVQCAAPARCTLEQTGPRCACPAGFDDVAGDGSRCVDVNECTSNVAGCSENATCENTPGGHSCMCKPGFAGDGTICKDAVPPTIVRVQPEKNAIGIWRAAEIVVTFSEPMDEQATRAAVIVKAPQPVEMTPTWQEGGTVLRLVPRVPFEYGAQVAINVTTAALDVAGNALMAGHDGSFRVVRNDNRQVLSGAPEGYVRSTGATLAQLLVVGDTETMNRRESVRGFISFDLTNVPTVATVRSARFSVFQQVCKTGTYTHLGRVLVEAVDIGDGLEAADFTSPALGPPNQPAAVVLDPGDVTTGWKTAELAAHVQDALTNRDARKNRLQVRLRFEIDVSGEGQDSSCSFSASSKPGQEPRLELEYEFP